jgi:hypothetical protein
MQKNPALWGAARGEVWWVSTGFARATRRCDSATPSFIPPLNTKKGGRERLCDQALGLDAESGVGHECGF